MQFEVKNYIEIIEKVAKVEHRRIPNHMVDYEELVSIGIIGLQALIDSKTSEQLAKFNNSYIATAVRWSIRNELRNRYKWYSFKHSSQQNEKDDFSLDRRSDGLSDDGLNINPSKIREAVYETILSIDSIASTSSDNDSPFDFIKDKGLLPDEAAELSELGKLIREAIARLPQKERTVVEYRFYRNMQVKEIAQQVGLSSSRITRIVQFSLNRIKQYLTRKDFTGY